VEPLSSEEVLRLWERGEGRAPAVCGLLMLAHARPGASPADLGAMTIGERELALLALRACTFGGRLVAVAACPVCPAGRVEFAVDVNELAPAGALDAGGAAAPGVRDARSLVEDGWRLVFRAPTVADSVALARCATAAAARTMLLQRCLREINAPDGTAHDAERLPPAVEARLAAAMTAADPTAELAADLVCPSCGKTWTAVLDIAAFLWKEITAQARRLVDEVRELALRYGWREADILRMSARRRRAYLEASAS
jgi:hypothetical protein